MNEDKTTQIIKEKDFYEKSNAIVMGGSTFSNEEDLIYTAALVHRDRRVKNSKGIYEIKFTISELKQILGYPSNNNYLRTIAPELETKMMTRYIGYEDYERGIFAYEAFFTGVEYNEETDEFTLKFNPALDNLNFDMLESGRYTTYSLQLRLKSTINIWSVYEFLKAKYDYLNAINKRKGLKENAIIKFTIDYYELRFKIGIDDINNPAAKKIISGKKNPDFKAAAEAIDAAYVENWKKENQKIYQEAIAEGRTLSIPNCRSYVETKYFIKNVLKPSKEWINKNTDMYVTYTTLKNSKRQIYAIEFQIGPKSAWNVKSEESQNECIEYVTNAFIQKEIPIKEKDARAICEIYRWNMSEFTRYFDLMCTQKIRSSYVGWLKSAYEKQYIKENEIPPHQMDFSDIEQQKELINIIINFGLDSDIFILEKQAFEVLEHIPDATRQKVEKLIDELKTEIIDLNDPINNIIHICDDIFNAANSKETKAEEGIRSTDEMNMDIMTTKKIFRDEGFDPMSNGQRIDVDSYRSLLSAAGYEKSSFICHTQEQDGVIDKFVDFCKGYSKDIDNIIGLGIKYFTEGGFNAAPVKKKTNSFTDIPQRQNSVSMEDMFFKGLNE